jgi:hypothetical protein
MDITNAILYSSDCCWSEPHIIRCNKCDKLFYDELELASLEDEGGLFNGCDVCETDGYLTNINTEEAE